MKKTLTVNLNQRVYHIDEDAYNLLLEYLTSLSEAFSTEADGGEIVADIEGRVGELCDERLGSGRQVVTVDDVREIITRMGRPDEFAVDDDAATVPPGFSGEGKESSAQPPVTPPPYTNSTETKERPKRLYRDGRDKLIGGVCSGLAAYFDLDPTWVRLAAILLFVFFNGITLITYIVLWLVLPVAQTPNDYLHMTGQTPTLDSIGRTVTDGYNRVKSTVTSPESRSLFKRICQGVVVIAAALFKTLLAILAVIAVPVVIAGCLAVMCSLVSAVMFCVGEVDIASALLSFFDLNGYSLPWSAIFILGGIGLTAAIPFFSLLYWALRGLFPSIKPFGKGAAWTLFILWCMGVAMIMLGGMMPH